MFYYPEKKKLVLEGELDFDITEEAHATYQRLKRIAEDTGAFIEAHLTHGGYIKVFPPYGGTYFLLGVYDQLDKEGFPEAGKLKVTSVKVISTVKEIWFDNATAMKEISIPEKLHKIEPVKP